MAKSKPATSGVMKDLVGDGARAMVYVIYAGLLFFAQQLNSTMKELTVAIRAIEIRVTSIEVERASNKNSYNKLLEDVGDLKIKASQIEAKLDNISRNMK